MEKALDMSGVRLEEPAAHPLDLFSGQTGTQRIEPKRPQGMIEVALQAGAHLQGIGLRVRLNQTENRIG